MPTPAERLATVIQQEKDALAAETRIAQCPPFVAGNDLADVTRLPSKLRCDHKATFRGLTQARGPVFTVECPSLQSTALWVGTELIAAAAITGRS